MDDPITPQQEALLRQAAADLLAQGYAVIPGVLSPAEQASARAGLALSRTMLLEGANVPALISMKGIIMNPAVLSHADWVWEVRKKAAPYFARLYGSGALLSSFDRINNYQAVPAQGQAPRPGIWLHTDQSALRDGLLCVQGFVDVNGTGPLDAGLQVVPRSHLRHHELCFRRWGVRENADWIKFTDEQYAEIVRELGAPITVQCPPGSLVIWESKTFHQNRPPLPGGQERLVVYTCFQPLPTDHWPEKRVATMLAKKQKAFREQRATSHWPLTGRLFGTTERTYGRKDFVQPKFNPNAAQLIGQPDPATDLVVASLAGFSRAPAIRFDPNVPPPAPLLPFAPLKLLIENKKQLLARLEPLANKGGVKKRLRETNIGGEDDDIVDDA